MGQRDAGDGVVVDGGGSHGCVYLGLQGRQAMTDWAWWQYFVAAWCVFAVCILPLISKAVSEEPDPKSAVIGGLISWVFVPVLPALPLGTLLYLCFGGM